MSKADEKYEQLILDIHENGVWDTGEEVRTKYADGSPAYTKSIFGRQITFEEGEIPILTSKFTGWKTALKEMMLFWIHQTVKKEDFEAWNVKVWDEWFLDDGTLGKSYAYQFESRPIKEIIKIRRRYHEVKDEFHPVKLDNVTLKEGEVVYDSQFGDFIIISKKGRNNTIQFLETGYKYTVSTGNLNKRQIKDIYSYNGYNGYGCIGNPSKDTLTDIHFKKLKTIWQNMLNRCYDDKSIDYSSYGGKGVFVSDRWKCFEFFLQDIKKIPQYFIAKQFDFEGWGLDKDYYGSNCYSENTCVWLTKSENSCYRSAVKPFYFIVNGEKKIYISGKDCALDLGITSSEIYRYLNETIREGCLNPPSSVKGYTGSYLKVDHEYLYRYNLSSNQVVDLINNINTNPMSRRLMTSFWNYDDVHNKALQECAMQTTWNVRNGKLDLLLYSRSVDSALGLPFNWIQYWFLQQMVAQATGLKAGTFTHQMGNIHYYDRHEFDILKQLDNNTYDQPEFWINPKVTNYFQFTPEDIKLVNYDHSGKYKYEVAI